MGNTTTTNNKKKKSNARKLIPAIGMLMTSAAMLTTSTYAWFTMNREVSITGITLTATVPETIEISLGIKEGGSGSGNIIKPSDGPRSETVDASGEDWSNTVAINTYYEEKTIGNLLPVSSTNGLDMFYTEEATEHGKELKNGINVISVSSDLVSNELESDRYYIDIPVWFRTTTTGVAGETVDLSVSAEVTGLKDSDVLYKATRISILGTNNGISVESLPTSSFGVILPTESKYFKSDDQNNPLAIASAGNKDTNFTRSNVTFVDQTVSGGNNTGTTVVSIPVNTSDKRYGDMTKRVVRIWLEGEDENCFDTNAGQSFNVGLTFTKK